MQQETVTVGVGLAKNVFRVHAIDAEGKVLVRRQVRPAELLRFFAGCRLARSGWRRALRLITGLAS
jgi:hypothetical protein